MHRLLLSFFLLCSIHLFSQSDTIIDPNRRFELGVNITNTLAGFFNSGGTGGSTDPYLISLKLPKKGHAWRFGFNIDIRGQTEFVDFSGDRTVNEIELRLRSGLEWRTYIGSKFQFYWGLDLLTEYEHERIEGGVSFSDNPLQTIDIYGIGFGPNFGINYYLTPRLILSTEASLYGIALYKRDELKNIQFNPNTSTSFITEERLFELAPIIPNSLYLIFRF